MNRLITATLALLTACATPSAQTEAERPAVTEPLVNAHPVVSQPAVEHPGWESLPKELSKDPSTLAIAPLELNVVKPQRTTLPNGLELYFIEDHAVPLVNIVAQFYVGGIEEPAEKLGLVGTLFDLMVSGGAGKLDADQMDDLLEFHAANAGGGADVELSSVSMNLRSQDQDVLLPVFADMILRPRLQKDRFENSILQQIEGVHRRGDSPDGLAMRAVRKAVFGPTSLFARETSEATLKSLTLADLQHFYGQYVVPKATRLLVTGDFDQKTMLAKLTQLFGGWKGGEPAKRSLPAAKPLSRRVIFIPKELAQTKIRIGAYGFKRLDPDEYAIRVMANALGGGIGAGRLFREVRDAKGLAYSAWAQAQPGPSTGLFLAGADTRPEQSTKALSAILDIFKDTIGARPFSKDELKLAADMYLNSFAFRFDEPEKVAREKAVYDVFGYPEDYLDTYRDRIAKVDADKAQSAAKKILNLDALQIVVVGPPSKVGDLSSFGPVTTITDVDNFK